MEYAHRDIEQKWQQYWKDKEVYKVSNDSDKPKYYVLDMFPYPSGAGLHVGHPLGYIASDILARYKRHCGFNVLHPMGYDAFGLPAEQYALETGQHPAVTTEQNIKRYRQQLDNIGFCYDWSREVRTSDPKYYKWTQWIFIQLFHSWYDRTEQKAKHISELISIFEKEGNTNHPCPGNEETRFAAEEWKSKSEKEQRDILMDYRLAYLSYAEVWWCEALGTVLANDEVVNGVSERGGHPVVKKKMHQWFLRITEYADRLLSSLDKLEWTDAMKEMQRNWIGKSMGAEVEFYLSPAPSPKEKGTNKNPTPSPSPQVERGIGSPKYTVKSPHQYEHARLNRKEATEAEDRLWQELRDKKTSTKFRRQHPIDEYIVDFVSLNDALIIEVDGRYHSEAGQKEYDDLRTVTLEKIGFKILRFSNDEVLNDISSVIEKIRQHTSPSPPVEKGSGDEVSIKVFTTRPDTIFGVDFMVLAPEHELVNLITTKEQQQAIDKYKEYVQSRSERERMTEVKQITGAFTGAYVEHPFTGKSIPVWISEYVLAGYGTGAIMAVPSGDERDHAFAKHFNIPITNVFGKNYNGEEAYSDKAGTIENSDFLSGKNVSEAIDLAINAIVEKGIGRAKVNYKLRDAGFSRQRYWGEPFPIVYTNDTPYTIDEIDGDTHQLPVELPHVDSYKPGPEGQGPLANITDWVNLTPTKDSPLRRETNTMPGYAGSSWYFLRYMDPHNDEEFASKKATDYWNSVDVYIGGTEHAVGHLLYSRMWTKALHDLGHIGFDEPFKKLINQGMIQGSSRFVYRLNLFSNNPKFENYKTKHPLFISYHPVEWKKKDYFDLIEEKLRNNKVYSEFINDGYNGFVMDKLHVDINYVDGVILDINKFKKWRPEYANAEFILDDDGGFYCCAEIEKMSKSKYNVVNPDDIVEQYGADTFRMYEMFLGPIDVSKPWDTKGIEGVHRFLKKLWRLYNDDNGWAITDETATEGELKVLHKTIKKVREDIEKFSFNTSVSQFMICVNELSGMNCRKRSVLEPLAILIAPFAPHLAEELWYNFGHEGSVTAAAYPDYDEKYVTENCKKYPVAINGKARTEMEFPLDMDKAELEKQVMANEVVQKWVDGKQVKKFIYVPGRMINVVV